MANSTEDLLIRIDATTEQLRRELRRADVAVAGTSGNIEKQLARADKAFDRLGAAGARAGRIVGGAAAAGTAALAAMTVGTVRTAASFEKLEASLRTVTGSQQSANQAFAWLQDFSTETPYQLDEVVGGFIKLKALGLDPSREALEAYGNTAAAMGKSLDQMIEAVADASTGEFERLKEFGIRASQQGDQVSFTFQGVTTTVGKSAAEIEGYLRQIGQSQFAGAMNEQMDTIDGAFSNFGDTLAGLQHDIGKAGLSRTVIEITKLLRKEIDDNKDAIIEATRVGLETVADVIEAIGRAQVVIEQNPTMAWGGLVGYAFFGKLGASVGIVAGHIIDELNDKLDIGKPALQARMEDVQASISGTERQIASLEEELGRSRIMRANPFASTDVLETQLEQAKEQLRGLWEEQVNVFNEMQGDPAVQDYWDDQVRVGNEAMDKLADKIRETVAGLRDQDLTGGGAGGAGGGAEPPGNGPVGDPFAFDQARLDQLLESQKSERELLSVHLEEQQWLVEDAFQAGYIRELERKDALEQLEADHKARLLAIEEKSLTDLEKLKRTSWSNQSATVLGNIAAMTAGVAQGNRTMFQINKIAALAEGALSFGKTVMDAYEWGTAVGGPVLGSVYAGIAGAAQAANLAAISATSYGGGTAPSYAGTGAGSTVVTTPAQTPTGGAPGSESPSSRVYVEFEGADDTQVSLREFREQIRRLKEDNPNAELVF